MPDRIDIRHHTEAIAAKLGLEPHLIRRLIVEVDRAQAEVFKTNDGGSRYIDPDTNDAATELREWQVRS